MKKFSIAKYQKELAKIRRLRKVNPDMYINFTVLRNGNLLHNGPYSHNNGYGIDYFDWKSKLDNYETLELIYFIGTPDHLFVESK
jgi:hypothetical protein